MAEYLSVIVTLSLFSAIINAFLNEKGATKTVKSVISLVLVTVTIIPIVKNLAFFKDNYSLPIINYNDNHIIDNVEDDVILYRRWLAKATAQSISEDVTESVKRYTGIDVRVECPWHLDGDNVVFDVLLVYTNCDERYYEKIKNTIKLHYKLDSKCVKV